jgi:hypothetical protein
VADGASQANLNKWTDTFFKSVPASSSSKLQLNTAASKYFGGEQRTARPGKSAYVIAFPGASLGDNKPEVSVLAALLGGETNIKWSTGFTLLSKAASNAPGVQAFAHNHAYSDAGLLTISISGPAAGIKTTAEEAVKAVKAVAEGSVSKEDLTKAISKAKFDLLSASETTGTGIVATGAQLIRGGAPLDVAAAVKNLESVSGDKLKAVCTPVDTLDSMCEPLLTKSYRLPRLFSRARLPLLPLVISTCCLMLRTWVSRYKVVKGFGKGNCTSSGCCCRVTGESFVHIVSSRLGQFPRRFFRSPWGVLSLVLT